MYENWEADADRKAEEFKDGWEAVQAALQEDEDWALYVWERQSGAFLE